jgi:hypothetical protein
MEVVADDPGVRQRRADRLAVTVVGVDRDDLDARPNLDGQRRQPALHRAAVAPVEELNHAPAVQVRDHGGQLAAAAVMGLIERSSTRPVLAVARLALLGPVGERARHLVAAGVLLARDLCVRRAIGHALGQPCTEASGHALTRGQLLVGLGDVRPQSAHR